VSPHLGRLRLAKRRRFLGIECAARFDDALQPTMKLIESSDHRGAVTLFPNPRTTDLAHPVTQHHTAPS
jgi:hypothetical protein